MVFMNVVEPQGVGLVVRAILGILHIPGSIPPGRNNWGHWGSLPVDNARASWILVGSNPDTTVIKKKKKINDFYFSEIFPFRLVLR